MMIAPYISLNLIGFIFFLSPFGPLEYLSRKDLFASSALVICLSFLWHRYIFDKVWDKILFEYIFQQMKIQYFHLHLSFKYQIIYNFPDYSVLLCRLIQNMRLFNYNKQSFELKTLSKNFMENIFMPKMFISNKERFLTRLQPAGPAPLIV